jgi:tRNA A37 threonylcarbamoyladenosine modification protein TsaB
VTKIKIVNISEIRKNKKIEPIKINANKNHAELLKEAFRALDRQNNTKYC